MALVSSTVEQLVRQAVDGHLDIPEFQRGYVWRPDQVAALVDSLYRDYPIGQILTWENPDYSSPRTALGTQSPRLWLVDGQQRTTALCLLFGRKPYWWSEPEDWNRRLAATEVLVDVTSDANEVEFGLSNPVRAADPRWVSVREILSIEGPDSTDSFQGIVRDRSRALVAKLPARPRAPPPAERVEAVLRRLWGVRNEPVPVVDVHHGIEDVAEIFTRLNQQGTEIAESDVTLAVVATFHPGWVREEFLPFLRNLAESGFQLDPGIVLRILTALGEGKARLNEVSRGFWEGSVFDATWQSAREALTVTVSELMGAGMLSSMIIPSRNALVPLAVLRSKYGTKDAEFGRALHWFLMANRDGRYSGASTTALSEDIRLIRNSAGFAEAMESLRDQLEVDVRVQPAEFLGRASWNRPLLLILYLALVQSGAVDWATRRSLGRGRGESKPEYGFEPYWHPFFPVGRSVLRSSRLDFSDDEVGALANLVLMNQKPPERGWSTSAPAKYLAEPPVSNAEFELQAIPTDRTLWDPERYRDFLGERSKLLASMVNAYLASLLGAAREKA
jgi:hypothetical protein